jgi:lysophospholipase L1-like esterase
MFEVVCFGDSNTWGYSPETRERFPREMRWTGVLQRALGAEYHVMEEGQNGRTTVWDDPVEGNRKNGLKYLLPCLESHHPLDLVVMMLGTNDLKIRYSVSPMDIGWSVRNLAEAVLKSAWGPGGAAPRLLLIAPPPLAKLTEFADLFDGGVDKSRRLGKRYADVAAEVGCAFLDAGSIVKTSDLDGVHFEAAEHKKLGEAVAREVRRLLPA